MTGIIAKINLSVETGSELKDIAERTFVNLETMNDVTGWMDLVRTCRHPQHLWNVDYIEKSDNLKIVESLIRKSEDILYGSLVSITLKEKFTASLEQEICFHTIRAYFRYEDGDFESAQKIWESLYAGHYDNLSLIRKSNLLFHCFIFYLFTRQFDKAYQFLHEHWLLIKYAPQKEKYSLGLWDNEAIMQCVIWFFMEHVEDFVHFFANKIDAENHDIFSHKKVSFINFISSDISWIISLATPDLYRHSMTLINSLPSYSGPLPNTPRNEGNYFPVVEADGEQYSYLSQYLEEQLRHGLDHELLACYQENYIHCNRDYSDDITKVQSLLSFLSDNLNEEEYRTILDAGCGNAGGFAYDHFENLNKSITGIDISDYITHKMIKDDNNVKLTSLQSFLPSVEVNDFDLFFSCDLLTHIGWNINKLITDWSKFKYLCILLENYPEVYDTGYKHLTWTLHKDIREYGEWISMFSHSHNIEYKLDGDNILLFGRNRNLS